MIAILIGSYFAIAIIMTRLMFYGCKEGSYQEAREDRRKEQQRYLQLVREGSHSDAYLLAVIHRRRKIEGYFQDDLDLPTTLKSKYDPIGKLPIPVEIVALAFSWPIVLLVLIRNMRFDFDNGPLHLPAPVDSES